MPRALAGLADGSLEPQPQSDDGVTYASKLGPDDQRVNWTASAEVIDCQIRGLSPFPGAYCYWQASENGDPVRLKLLMSERVSSGATGKPGEVLDDELLVACGDGQSVRILRLQKPGGKPMAARDFLRGAPVPPGTLLT